jgi:PAS domain S-box-containing protein
MTNRKTKLLDLSSSTVYQELIESEKNFRTIFESAPIGILITSKEMRPMRTNPAFQAMLGFTDEELLKAYFTEFTHRDDIETSVNLFEMLLEGIHDHYTFEKRYLTKDGGFVWANVAVSSVRDSNGDLLYTIAMVQDITERKKALDELKNSEEKYRLVIENANEAILVTQGGISKFFNPKTVKLTGYIETELESIPFVNLVHADDKDMFLEQHLRRLKGEDLEQVYSFRIVDKKGEIKWVEVNAVLITWKGTPATLNFLTDISKRKRAELALRESEGRFRTIFESAPIGILITNKEMHPIQTNRAFQDMLGYTDDELIKTTFADFTHPEDIDESVSLFNGLLRRSYDYYRLEKRYIRKTGEIVWAYLVVTSVLDNNGDLLYTIAMVEDISARKTAENALRKRELELEVQAKYLEEANAALKVLLKQREEDKEQLEKSVLSNVKQLVVPYLDKVKNTQTGHRQKAYLDVLETNLYEIISPFAWKMSSSFYQLTPRELQIADFIKNGKTSKEIAEILNVSTRTVDFHRHSLRSKLELKNKKINLRTFLLNIANTK